MKKVILATLLIGCLVVPSAFSQYGELIGKTTEVVSSSGFVVVRSGASKNAFNSLMGNMMSLSHREVMILLLSHNAFEIVSGTKVKVLDIDFRQQAVQVEIVSGSYARKKGWILFNEIKK
jgi:hypothetical protein